MKSRDERILEMNVSDMILELARDLEQGIAVQDNKGYYDMTNSDLQAVCQAVAMKVIERVKQK